MHNYIIVYALMICTVQSQGPAQTKPQVEMHEERCMQEKFKDADVVSTVKDRVVHCELPVEDNMALFMHLVDNKIVIDKFICPKTEYGDQSEGVEYLPETLNLDPSENRLFSLRKEVADSISVEDNRNCSKAYDVLFEQCAEKLNFEPYKQPESPTEGASGQASPSTESVEAANPLTKEQLSKVYATKSATAPKYRLAQELCSSVRKGKLSSLEERVFTQQNVEVKEVFDHDNERVKCTVAYVQEGVRFKANTNKIQVSGSAPHVVEVIGDQNDMKINVKNGGEIKRSIDPSDTRLLKMKENLALIIRDRPTMPAESQQHPYLHTARSRSDVSVCVLLISKVFEDLCQKNNFMMTFSATKKVEHFLESFTNSQDQT